MPLDAKTLCLGALEAGFTTGYDIRKAFEDGPFRHYQSLSYGSIYPALNGLLADGLATCSHESQSGRPDRKVYGITKTGRSALRDALLGHLTFDRLRSDYMFALAFAHLMATDQVSGLLDAYAQGYRALSNELTAIETENAPPPADRFLLRMGQDVCRTWADWIDKNRGMLEDDVSAPAARRLASGAND
jgi:DNA-binding PadR family transcriptional regulator